MNQNVIYIGIDVDDVQYHGSALDKSTGEVLDFRCRPMLKGLVGQLKKVREYFGGGKLELCYEASYVGYDKLGSVQRFAQTLSDCARCHRLKHQEQAHRSQPKDKP